MSEEDPSSDRAGSVVLKVESTYLTLPYSFVAAHCPFFTNRRNDGDTSFECPGVHHVTLQQFKAFLKFLSRASDSDGHFSFKELEGILRFSSLHNVPAGRKFVAERLTSMDANPARLLALGVRYRLSDIFLSGFMRLAGSQPDRADATYLNALPTALYDELANAWRDVWCVRKATIERDMHIYPGPRCVYGCTQRSLGSCLSRVQHVYQRVAHPLLVNKVYAADIFFALSDAISEDVSICATCSDYYDDFYLNIFAQEITISREAAMAALSSRKKGDVQWDY